MEAMLEHSKQNYGPLPGELRPFRVRSRTSSRASPYPVRTRRISLTAEIQANMVLTGRPFDAPDELPTACSRESSINSNTRVFTPPQPLETQPFSSFSIQLDSVPNSAAKYSNGLPRPRVTSSARRAALGWSKRSTGKSSTSSSATSSAKSSTSSSAKSSTSSRADKENVAKQEIIFRYLANLLYRKTFAHCLTSANDSLRISRPRPRGRPVPAHNIIAAV